MRRSWTLPEMDLSATQTTTGLPLFAPSLIIEWENIIKLLNREGLQKRLCLFPASYDKDGCPVAVSKPQQGIFEFINRLIFSALGNLKLPCQIANCDCAAKCIGKTWQPDQVPGTRCGDVNTVFSGWTAMHHRELWQRRSPPRQGRGGRNIHRGVLLF